MSTVPRPTLRRTLLVPARMAVLAAAAAAVLAGCTTASRSTSDAFRLLFRQGLTEPTAEQVAALPYPQLQLKAKDVNGVLVLGHVDGRQQTWYAGKDAVFYLEPSGLVTGTNGIGRTVRIAIDGVSPFDDLSQAADGTRVQRRYDWTPGYRMGVPITGTLNRTGTEEVEILGRQRTLTRYEETLAGPGIDETNIYWADESGFIWKSTQFLAPGNTVEIVQLKPYRPANS